MSEPGYNANGAVCVIEDVDFSKINSGAGLASSGTYEAMSIPADTLVLAVSSRRLEAVENGDDLDVGDGADPDGWIDGVDHTSGGVEAELGRFPTTNEKHYTSADTIDITNNNASGITKGKVRIKAVCIFP